MRTKALLVDALAGTQGPTVHLEQGVWEIDSHPFVQVVCVERDTKIKFLNGLVKIHGPARVRLNVNPKYQGAGIDAQARQVA